MQIIGFAFIVQENLKQFSSLSFRSDRFSFLAGNCQLDRSTKGRRSSAVVNVSSRIMGSDDVIFSQSAIDNDIVGFFHSEKLFRVATR